MNIKQLFTNKGPMQAQIISVTPELEQINVFAPPTGAPFFVVYAPADREHMLSEVVRAVEAAQLTEENQDVTTLIDKAITAGTYHMPKFELGVPTVSHAEAGHV